KIAAEQLKGRERKSEGVGASGLREKLRTRGSRAIEVHEIVLYDEGVIDAGGHGVLVRGAIVDHRLAGVGEDVIPNSIGFVRRGRPMRRVDGKAGDAVHEVVLDVHQAGVVVHVDSVAAVAVGVHNGGVSHVVDLVV